MAGQGKHAKLREARTHLTPDLMTPNETTSFLYLLRDIFFYIGIVTLLWHTHSIFLLIPLWIAAGLVISGLFILGHDAAHGSLFSDPRRNYIVGQLAMLPSLHAFHQWVYGHNRIHHGHTVKIKADFIWHPVSPEEYKTYSLPKKLWHRFCWSPLGAGPYYFWETWFKGMLLFTAPQKNAQRDKNIIILFLMAVTAGTVAFGGQTPEGYSLSAGIWTFFRVFGIPFIIWNYIMGFTVYVQHINPEIAWQPSREWTSFTGQIEGTMSFTVPRWYNFFLHNIYVHTPHHVHMKIPFYKLPKAFDILQKAYPRSVHHSPALFRHYRAITA
ncbi:MAG: fatty acid desaturase, partial [Fibrobacterota bacterium]